MNSHVCVCAMEMVASVFEAASTCALYFCISCSFIVFYFISGTLSHAIQGYEGKLSSIIIHILNENVNFCCLLYFAFWMKKEKHMFILCKISCIVSSDTCWRIIYENYSLFWKLGADVSHIFMYDISTIDVYVCALETGTAFSWI